MTPCERTEGSSGERIRNALLGIIAVLLVIAGLRWSAPVTMPLAFAGFLIALCWPIQEWLNQKLPRHPSFSFVGTTIALLVVLAVLLGVLYFTGQSVASTLPKYTDQFQQMLTRVQQFAKGHGLPAPQQMFGSSNAGAYVQSLISAIYNGLAELLFILALTILGLPAVVHVRSSIRRYWGGERGYEIVAIATTAAHKIQRWLATGTVTSVITGILTGLWCWALGLDIALFWALIAYLLNYIPTVGSVIAVIPPTLFAFVQFQGWLLPIGVFLGLTVMQIAMGSFIFPNVAGRALLVMPVVVLFAIAFWGWVWGIGGAILATPLTSVILIVCAEFRSTRWITALLARDVDLRPRQTSKEARSQAS